MFLAAVFPLQEDALRHLLPRLQVRDVQAGGVRQMSVKGEEEGIKKGADITVNSNLLSIPHRKSHNIWNNGCVIPPLAAGKSSRNLYPRYCGICIIVTELLIANCRLAPNCIHFAALLQWHFQPGIAHERAATETDCYHLGPGGGGSLNQISQS